LFLPATGQVNKHVLQDAKGKLTKTTGTQGELYEKQVRQYILFISLQQVNKCVQ